MLFDSPNTTVAAPKIPTHTSIIRPARRLIGPLFADPLHLDGGIVRRMFTFGGWTQVTSLLNVVIVDADLRRVASPQGIFSRDLRTGAAVLATASRRAHSFAGLTRRADGGYRAR